MSTTHSDIEKKDMFTAEVHPVQDGFVDEVFGVISEDGPQYRSLGFWGTFVVMVKTMIGLGVLSIPFLYMVVGMIPGIILFLFISICVTWCNYIIGEIKIRHPQVYSIDDLGYLVAGEVGRNVVAICSNVYFIMISGSGMLSISIAFNAISAHGTCTAVFVVVSAILVFSISSIRTLSKISIVSWIGVISIFVAVFVLMIAVGVQDRPAAAPAAPAPWERNIVLFGAPTWAAAGSTIGGIIFTLSATPAFFSIASEMRNPEHYSSASLYCNALITVVDIVVGIVVYYYCGQYVASPSPGSAGVLFKKIVYGLALPGVTVSTVLYTHIPAKYIFVRLLRGTKHLSSNSWTHWIVWLSCTGGVTIVGYIIASGIPIFSSLCSLIGAFFGPTVSLLPLPIFWLWDHWDSRNTRKFRLMAVWAGFVIFTGFFCQALGTYGAVVDIITGFRNGAITKPWSCADNSNSVPKE